MLHRKTALHQIFVYLVNEGTEIQQLGPLVINMFLVCFNSKTYNLSYHRHNMDVYQKHSIRIAIAVIIAATTPNRHNCVSDS